MVTPTLGRVGAMMTAHGRAPRCAGPSCRAALWDGSNATATRRGYGLTVADALRDVFSVMACTINFQILIH